MKQAQYKVAIGSHYDVDGREYTQGQIVESWSDLCAAFPNKFTLVREADFSPDVPVAPTRVIIQPIQPKTVEVAPAPVVTATAEQTQSEPVVLDSGTSQESAPAAEPPKKKRKVVLD